MSQGTIGDATAKLCQVGIHVRCNVGVGSQVGRAIERCQRFARNAAFVQAVLHEVVQQVGGVEVGVLQVGKRVLVVGGVERGVGFVAAGCTDLHEVLDGRQGALVVSHVLLTVEEGVERDKVARLGVGQCVQGCLQLSAGGEVRHRKSLFQTLKKSTEEGGFPARRPE